jgi:ribosomal protein L21E
MSSRAAWQHSQSLFQKPTKKKKKERKTSTLLADYKSGSQIKRSVVQ